VGHLNLVLALEQEFRVQFSPDDIEKMLSVQQILQVLERQRIGSVS
jgi:acyl carrier protein